jgi:hypothetical protein
MISNRQAPIGSRDGDVGLPVREQRTVRSTYQHLRMVGLSPSEAGNLTAHLNGLRVAEPGWTLEEIERLLFIRALVDLGRIPS